MEAAPNAHCPNLNKNPLTVPGPPNNLCIIFLSSSNFSSLGFVKMNRMKP